MSGNKRISELTLLPAASIATDDLFVVVDVSAPDGSKNKKTTLADLLTAMSSGGAGFFQPLNSNLTSLASLTLAADKVLIATAANTVAQLSITTNTFPARGSTGSLAAKTITDFGLDLVDSANTSQAQSTLGLVIGTNVQAWDTQLDSLASLSYTSNSLKVLRVNAGETGFELATLSAVPTTITVANEATDTTCFPAFFTAASGDLGPKSNTALTFNAATANLGCTTFTGSLVGNASTATNVAVGGITGLGTGVATALAVNVGSAGAFVAFNGAGGTPSSITLTNATGTAASLTAGNATLAATVTTNANLTGVITSVGNATSIASQTGTGTTFAMSANPVFSGTPSCTGGQTNSEVYGSGASVSAGAATALGNGATAAGSSVAIGRLAAVSSTIGVAIGTQAAAAGTDVAIGGNSSTTGNSVAIGQAAASSGASSALVGQNASGSGVGVVGVGRSVSLNFNFAMAFGFTATATAANQLVIGGNTGNGSQITQAYIGSGVTDTSPTSIVINATGGSGTNIAGASCTIAGGKGTGTGVGGSVIIQTAVVGTTGTTLQTLATRLTLDSLGNVVCGNAVLATSATDGFLYVPSCAGTPSGTPTAFTGRVPIIYDSTNDILYIYRSGWKKATASIVTGAITWV